MECPRCSRETTQETVGGIAVDVCAGGCGGIWFDPWELDKVDEKAESAGEELLHVDRDPQDTPDLEVRLKCPRCDDVVLRRHFTSVKRGITVDECPGCGGFWLDAGELGGIRDEYETDEERDQAAGAYFSEIFDPEMKAEREKTMQDLASKQRFAHAFRFVCPSYYIHGKQDWGAY
jgi:Zn-finger nucleic acid-binding protein